MVRGFCVFDVFESEEAVQRFREVVTTIPQVVGIEQPPANARMRVDVKSRAD
jgi:hypothetical protein